MMKEEFEKLAGYEVTYSDYYQFIEPMYNALDYLSKKDFVEMLDRKRFDYRAREKREKKKMLNKMKEIAEERAENCEHFCDYEAEEKLQQLAQEFVTKYYVDKAITFEIKREHWEHIPSGCTYPAELVLYYTTKNGSIFELERFVLAD